MKRKKAAGLFTSAEIKLVERLRESPEMLPRVQEIMALADCKDGPLKMADEVEEFLIAAIHYLGHEIKSQWASGGANGSGTQGARSDGAES